MAAYSVTAETTVIQQADVRVLWEGP